MDDTTRHARLRAWLAQRLEAPELELGPVEVPGHGGLSATTWLVSVRWPGGHHELAVRLDPGDEGIFPTYDLSGEFALLRALGERTDVPVAPVRWLEPDPAVLGRPFYVADRVAGRVPGDDPPFQVAGWLHEARPAEQATAQRTALEALAAVHRVDASTLGLRLPARERFGPPGLGQDLAYWRHYLDWTQQDGQVPVLEAIYAWCVAHRPATEPAAVLCWGDTRYPNIVYDDGCGVAALLDWEMALLGPPELDLGWLVFLHEATLAWVDDLPGFRSRDETLAVYAAAAGREVTDLHWYLVWAGLRSAAIQATIVARRHRRGELPDLRRRHDNVVTRHLRGLLPDLPASP